VDLHIKKRDEPKLSEMSTPVFDKIPTCEEVLALKELVVRDVDGNVLTPTCRNITVNEERQELILHVADQVGMDNTFTIKYEIVLPPNNGVLESIVAYLFGFVVLCAIVFGIGRFIAVHKNNCGCQLTKKAKD